MTSQKLTDNTHAAPGPKHELSPITLPRQIRTPTDAKRPEDMTTQRQTNKTHATQGPKIDLSLIAPPRQEIPVPERNPKRKRGSDCEYEELTGTTTPQGQFDTWAKDASTRWPDIKRCIQVGSDTFALKTMPGTHSIEPTEAMYKKNIQTIEDKPKKYKKPKSGSQKNQPSNGSYKGRRAPFSTSIHDAPP
jgi:hypothetical protein